MNAATPFKWRHFEAKIILLCVRWYLRYALSYRDLEEMMRERGLPIDHTTIYRWVQRYAPEREKRCRPHLKTCNDSWRVDETYIKVKNVWTYLSRAVDSEGNTLEFLSCVRRGMPRRPNASFSKCSAPLPVRPLTCREKGGSVCSASKPQHEQRSASCHQCG
jgi:transposase-like protein